MILISKREIDSNSKRELDIELVRGNLINDSNSKAGRVWVHLAILCGIRYHMYMSFVYLLC